MLEVTGVKRCFTMLLHMCNQVRGSMFEYTVNEATTSSCLLRHLEGERERKVGNHHDPYASYH